MSVRIRLTRRGRKNEPKYRLVVIEARKKGQGAYLENLGFYDPMTEPATLKIKKERVDYWLGVGAKPSHTVTNLLRQTRNKLKTQKSNPRSESIQPSSTAVMRSKKDKTET